jgi:hypothetical protein
VNGWQDWHVRRAQVIEALRVESKWIFNLLLNSFLFDISLKLLLEKLFHILGKEIKGRRSEIVRRAKGTK